MIDGPYGDSGDALADNYFYNNLVLTPRLYQNYATEKMLSSVRNWYDYFRKNPTHRYRGYPTLPLPKRKLTQNLWDFMGEPVGPNTTYYGTEPQTGGGGAGIPGAYAITKNINTKLSSQQDPENMQDIYDLIGKIKKHNGSLEYNELSLYVEPLISASTKYQFKSLKLISLAKKIKILSKKLQKTEDKKQRMRIISLIKSLIKKVWEKIVSNNNMKEAQTNVSSYGKFSWYNIK
jgi:hypothetical protein